MKNLASRLSVLTIIFILLRNYPLHAQWVNLNSNIQGELNSVFFLDDFEGYVVGEKGIFRTTNGGDTWNKAVIINNPADSAIYERTIFKSVLFTGLTWIACGADQLTNNGVIFRKNVSSPFEWQLAYQNTSGNALNKFGNQTNPLIAVGEDGLLLNSFSNEGLIWTETSIGLTTNDLYCAFENVISYIGGTDGTFAKNSNWEKISDAVQLDIINSPGGGAAGVTLDSVYGCYYNPPYWYCGGSYIIPNGYKGTCIGFNAQNQCIGTTNGIFSIINGLELQVSSVGYYINDFHFPSGSNTGYAACKNGIILKTTNNGGATQPVVEFNGQNGACVGNEISFYSQSNPTYEHSWQLDNEPPVSGYVFTTPIFTLPGQHTITLTISNVSQSASITKTFNIVEPPSGNVNYTTPDISICKHGEAFAIVHSSNLALSYGLENLSTPSADIQFVVGNGSNLLISTGVLSQPTTFQLVVKSGVAECRTIIPDSFLVELENTSAAFQPSVINATPGEQVLFVNQSQDATNFQWSFGSAAAILQSTEIDVSNSFSNTGLINVQLIASSANGCADTVSQSQLFVYIPGASSDCWATLEKGIEIPDLPYEHDNSYGIAIDKLRNAYVCGEYHHAIFGSKQGRPSPLNEGSGFYLAKYTPNGVLKWIVKSVEVEDCCFTNESHSGAAFDVAVDVDGAVLLTGWTMPGAIFYDSYGNIIKIPLEQQSGGGFILKISPEGKILWHGLFSQVPMFIDADEVGNIYLAGNLGHDAYYQPPGGQSVRMPFPPFEFPRHGLVKLSSDGQLLWKVSLDADFLNSYAEVGGLDVIPNGDIYLSGSFAAPGITFFSVHVPPVTLTGSSYQSDAYLAKFDTKGDLAWVNTVKTYNPSAPDVIAIDQSKQVVADANGDSYLLVQGGAFSISPMADITSSDGSVESVGLGSYILASYDPNGMLKWTAGVPFAQTDALTEIALNACGEIYVAGNFAWGGSFELATGNFIDSDGTPIAVTIDGRRILTLVYTSDGKLQNVHQIGELESSNQTLYNTPNDIVVDAANNLLLAGSLWITSSDSSFYMANDTLTPSIEDGFIAKINPDFCETELFGSIEGNVQAGNYCPGDTITIDFEAFGLGNITSDNEWQLLLSNENGCFDDSQLLQTIQSNLPSGSFQFVVPDSLLPGNYWLQINATQPNFSGIPFSVSLNLTPISKHLTYTICNGASIELLANDGTAWQWSPADGLSSTTTQQAIVTPTSSNTYTVIVSGLCGDVTDTFDVNLYPHFDPGFVLDTFICLGDSLLLVPNADLDIIWGFSLPNFYELGNGRVIVYPFASYGYPFKATDLATGCYIYDSVFVQIPVLNYEPVPEFLTTCPDSLLTLQVYSNDSIIVEWEDIPSLMPISNTAAVVGITESTWINYSISLPPYGCPVTDSTHIELVTVEKPELHLEAPYLITTGNYATYYWYLNGETIFGATNPNFIPVDTGFYQVFVIDFNGCSSFTDSLYFIPSATQHTTEGNITITPNPFVARVKVQTIATNFMGDIRIKDCSGKTIMTLQHVNIHKNGSFTIDGSQLPSGMYLIYLINEAGQYSCHKLIKTY